MAEVGLGPERVESPERSPEQVGGPSSLTLAAGQRPSGQLKPGPEKRSAVVGVTRIMLRAVATRTVRRRHTLRRGVEPGGKRRLGRLVVAERCCEQAASSRGADPGVFAAVHDHTIKKRAVLVPAH